ncbi:hypothetical protein ACGFNQ_23795 [Streptomyces asoensis]|uniref:hypothetical protein n=1 Tax=Streptomyces asoensis TaxID=249586 RepID=UPI0037215749
MRVCRRPPGTGPCCGCGPRPAPVPSPLLDLLATDDEQRVTAAVRRHLEMLRSDGDGDGA